MFKIEVENVETTEKNVQLQKRTSFEKAFRDYKKRLITDVKHRIKLLGLVRTGKMLDSVDAFLNSSDVDNIVLEAFVGKHYAKFLEFGTSVITPKRFMRTEAATQEKKAVRELTRAVQRYLRVL